MTINVNICVESPAEYFNCLRALLGGNNQALPADALAPQPAQPAARTKKTAEAPAAAPAASKPAETPTASAPAATEKAYTLADIAEIVPKCASKDRTRTVELLGKYGAKRGGELKATDYAAFIADANAFLAE